MYLVLGILLILGADYMNYGKHINNKKTPQTQPVLGREKEMSQNDAGGYTFDVTTWHQLNRFLILGAEGPTYYVSENTNVKRNASNIIACIKEDGTRVVNELVAISDAGRAIKNDPAIFTLGLVMKYGDDSARKAAYAAVPKVCRIGTHLFTLAQALSDLDKGWGRGTKRAFANWYLGKDVNSLSHQVAKYQSRNGWSNADILRLAHPKTTDRIYNSIFKWVVDKEESSILPPIIQGFEKAKKATSSSEVAELVRQYHLPRECVPTQFLDNTVWKELLPTMPLTALVRNLGVMTSKGLLTVTSVETQMVIKKLSDPQYIKRSRMHPISLLIALKQYSMGKGEKGNLTWLPVQAILGALNSAFYLAFDNVESTGKNYFLGIDVSSSMTSRINNTNLSSCEAVAAIAMTIMRTESKYWAYGFTSQFVDLKLNDRMDLLSAMKAVQDRNFGRTDCAIPMIYAANNNLDVDVFIILTDNETYFGNIHPYQALIEYRKKMNKPDAKLIVLATVSSNKTIADPKDINMIDMVGFDASIPTAIAEFARM